MAITQPQSPKKLSKEHLKMEGIPTLKDLLIKGPK